MHHFVCGRPRRRRSHSNGAPNGIRVQPVASKAHDLLCWGLQSTERTRGGQQTGRHSSTVKVYLATVGFVKAESPVVGVGRLYGCYARARAGERYLCPGAPSHRSRSHGQQLPPSVGQTESPAISRTSASRPAQSSTPPVRVPDSRRSRLRIRLFRNGCSPPDPPLPASCDRTPCQEIVNFLVTALVPQWISGGTLR